MYQFSIIIPMYNVASFIERAIISVYNQGLREDEFELILIDDGSPDDSAEIAKKITSNSSNVLLISQQNKGLGGARNTGINNAKGKYIIFLDADDWLLPGFLKKLLEENTSLDILEFGVDSVNSELMTAKTINFSSFEKPLNGVDYYIKSDTINSACNKLYSNAFIRKNNLFFIEHIYGEDFEFNTRALFLAERVNAFEAKGIAFYQNPNSITREKSKEKKRKYIDDLIQIIELIINFKTSVSKNQLSKKEEYFFYERLTQKNVNIFYSLLINNFSKETYKKIYKRLKSKDLLFLNTQLKSKKHNYFRLFLKYLPGLYSLSFNLTKFRN